mmetsp:Transcript_19388/g.18498  ORF Transcript_19388/g.18498 Transcript_19388/m.18498 type:complete len:285 (+) Transcript_19388:309-1163(+)
MRSSIFSLIAVTMGAGMLTLPYVISLNGVVWGSFLIIFGGLLSYFSGSLLVKCTELTGKYSYEEIAKSAFGSRVQYVVSLIFILSMSSYIIAYMTLFKTLFPQFLENSFHSVPYFLRKNEVGLFIYTTFFSFVIVLPLSIPRELSSMRFAAVLSVVCSVTVTTTIVLEFFTNKDLVPDPADNLHNADLAIFDTQSLTIALPFVFFLYLFQMNIPQTYSELNLRNQSRMDKVVFRVSTFSFLFYVTLGVFGYLTFSQNLQQLQAPSRSTNILEADYQGAVLISVS